MNLQTIMKLPLRMRRSKKHQAQMEAKYQELTGQYQLLLSQHTEMTQLHRLPSQHCDAQALGLLTEADLRKHFASPVLQREWHEDHRLLEPLALPEMTGGVNPGDQRAAYCLLRALKPKAVLEIGTHIGCSTVNMALAIKRLRSETPATDAQLLSVDIRDVNDPATRPWQEYGATFSPRQMVEKLGCVAFVSFKTADSLDFLAACDTNFDFIFLDGLHSADRVYQEVPLALRHLNPGGFILLHDYFPDLKPLWSNGSLIAGPWLAIQRLLNEGAGFRVLPLGALPWPTKLNSNVTSLALVVANRSPNRAET
jgi:predicted O-methyltransferase YrrM